MIICILRYDRGGYLNVKCRFSYKQESSAFLQSRKGKKRAWGDTAPWLYLGTVAEPFFPSLLQHPGTPGEAAGEYDLEGNHVTFKPGTFLDCLSIHESKVNVMNSLCLTVKYLWKIVIIILTMRRQICRMHFTFFKRPLDILSWMSKNMTDNCGGNCQSIFLFFTAASWNLDFQSLKFTWK